MWTYHNPVQIEFGAGKVDVLADRIAGRRYALITYPGGIFDQVTAVLATRAGTPAIVIDDIAPNPDCVLMRDQCVRVGAVVAGPGGYGAVGGG
ncbi:MAG: hypothetical protein AB3N23_21520, partial [Paracoccaceae bacterium]